MSYHFIFVIIAFILESNDDKDTGKKGTLTLLVIIGKLVQPVWKTVWSFLRKVKNRITVWSNNLTSGHLAKEIKSKRSNLGLKAITILKCLLQHYS